MRSAPLRLMCAAVCLVFLTAVMAGAEPSLYVTPPMTEVWNGEDCWVDIAINGYVTGLTGYDLVIDYDESLVAVMDVDEGWLPPSAGSSFFYWTTDAEQSNALVINGAVLGGSVDGPGVLASIHFSSHATGVSPVEFLSWELRDISNNPLPANTVDGQIDVVVAPTVYLAPSLTEVVEGEPFSIDVMVNAALQNLTGYDLRIAFDSSVVGFVDASEGPLPGSGGADTYFFYEIEGGLSDTLVLNGAVLGSQVDGPGVLATIGMVALIQGNTDLTFVLADLRDIDNLPIAAATGGAVVVVEPGGTAAEETTWSTLKAMFRANPR